MIMWSGIEACASTICANLPCYAPLLKRGSSVRYVLGNLRSILKSPHSLFSRRSTSKSTSFEDIYTERLASEPELHRNRTSLERNMVPPVTHESDFELAQMKV